MDKFPDDYLFSQHEKATVKRWLSQLRYFHFKRAWGGHANDGDTFIVEFVFPDRITLIEEVNRLGIVPGFNDSNNYGRNVLGKHCFWDIKDIKLELSVSGTADGNYYEVSEDDFNTCLYIEQELDSLSWLGVRNEERSGSYISKRHYPELYED